MSTPTACVQVEFDLAPPTQRLRPLVDADIHSTATPAQVMELKKRENLVTWIRVLNTIEHEIEEHIAKSRLSIAALKPSGGRAPSTAYLAAKRRVDERTTARLHVLGHVRAKRAEVASLISAAGLTPHTLGTVIDALVTLEDLIDGGYYQSASDYLSKLIDAYEKDERA